MANLIFGGITAAGNLYGCILPNTLACVFLPKGAKKLKKPIDPTATENPKKPKKFEAVTLSILNNV